MFEAKRIYRIDGTSALKNQPVAYPSHKPVVIPFETIQQRKNACQREERAQGKHARESVIEKQGNTFIAFVNHVLATSEMACSLMFESMSGCPFNMFTKRSIATLATSASLIALAALVIGI